MSDLTEADVVEHVSVVAFEPTVERIARRIVDAGLILFALVDHAAGARDAGLSMPPTTVLIYGHAKGGTPIMLACPQAALDLPLRVLVREREDGRTVIAFHPVVPTLRRTGVPDELSVRLEPAQRLLLEAITS